MSNLLKTKKVGFLGTGNMGQAIIRSLISTGTIEPHNIYGANRTPGKLNKLVELTGINAVANNQELFEVSDIIIIGVKPQDFKSTVENLSSFVNEDHIIISLAAGIQIRDIKRLLPGAHIVRAMPNTPIQIQKAVIGLSFDKSQSPIKSLVEDLFQAMGYVTSVDEGEMFEALMVACGSGTGFVFELMLYWQEWIQEHGFEPEVARRMVVETFLGAAELARFDSEVDLESLQRKVTSKKGVTAAGLESMRENEIERGLRISFGKAIIRDRELGKLLE